MVGVPTGGTRNWIAKIRHDKKNTSEKTHSLCCAVPVFDLRRGHQTCASRLLRLNHIAKEKRKRNKKDDKKRTKLSEKHMNKTRRRGEMGGEKQGGMNVNDDCPRQLQSLSDMPPRDFPRDSNIAETSVCSASERAKEPQPLNCCPRVPATDGKRGCIVAIIYNARHWCIALRFQISSEMLECNLWKTTSAETKLRLRAMDLLREHKTVNVSWWSRPQALHTIGVF